MSDSDLQAIKERNTRVEADKAWETSWGRRTFIAVVTYVLVAVHSSLIGVSYPWLNALVPAIGYLLSTVSIPYLKNFWLKNIYKNQES